jgi:hypothetical protein
LYMSRTERFKKSFFPSTTLMWNNLELIRDQDLSSVKVFKRSLCQYYDIQTYNKLYDFANDGFSSILHAYSFAFGMLWFKLLFVQNKLYPVAYVHL